MYIYQHTMKNEWACKQRPPWLYPSWAFRKRVTAENEHTVLWWNISECSPPFDTSCINQVIFPGRVAHRKKTTKPDWLFRFLIECFACCEALSVSCHFKHLRKSTRSYLNSNRYGNDGELWKSNICKTSSASSSSTFFLSVSCVM